MADEEIEQPDNVLLQVVFAAKTVRAQHHLLLRLQHMLLQHAAPGGGDDDATADEVVASLEEVVSDAPFRGLVAGVHYLAVGLKMEAQNGAPLALNQSFSAISGEQLYDALVAQRLPARPTTRAEAISRIEAALHAVKLPREHHLPRCIEHLTGKACGLARTGRAGLLAADFAKIGLPVEPLPAETTAAVSVDLDRARTCLDRACTLTSLAVKHIHIAVTVLSSFSDPKDVAEMRDGAKEMA